MYGDTREERIAIVNRELAEYRAAALEAEQAPARPARRSGRKLTGQSVVFSVRLSPAEVRALERRAALLGIAPTVLARNYVRIGLNSGTSESASRVARAGRGRGGRAQDDAAVTASRRGSGCSRCRATSASTCAP